MSHVCPAPTCTKRVPDHQLACRVHWYALPRSTRNAIWAAYEPGQNAATMSSDYRAALDEATRHWSRA